MPWTSRAKWRTPANLINVVLRSKGVDTLCNPMATVQQREERLRLAGWLDLRVDRLEEPGDPLSVEEAFAEVKRLGGR